MKVLNKFYLLNKGILVGDKNYNYKVKSLLSRKLYSNYIYNYEQSFFFITKVIRLIIDNSTNRGNVLIYSSVYSYKLERVLFNNKNINLITGNWVPGSLSNFKQYKKYNKINILKIPNLIILLGNSHLDNLDILEEASHFLIPVIMMFPNNLKFDNLYYPLIGNYKGLVSLKFYCIFFLNCIIHGLFLEKVNKNYAFKT